MRYIAAEDVARAKEMDLLTYLRNYEPQELVHVSGNTYRTREHDSLRISNGMGFKPHRHAALFLSSPFPLLPRSGKDEQ